MPANPKAFPVLDSGMIAHLPVRLEISKLTRATRFPDGSLLAAISEARLRYQWTLSYENLSQAEWQRLQDFIAANRRGSDAFVFPDPAGNLLAQSANLQGSTWIAPPGLTVDTIEDAERDNSFILTNPNTAPLELTQTVNLEGGFHTCFSIYAKWAGGTNFGMRLSDAANQTSKTRHASMWERNFVNLPSGEEALTRTVAIVVPPTTQIIVSAPQLEIAASPGAYLKTGDAGCIFTEAWLSQRAFESQSKAPGAHSMTLRIESFRSV